MGLICCTVCAKSVGALFFFKELALTQRAINLLIGIYMENRAPAKKALAIAPKAIGNRLPGLNPKIDGGKLWDSKGKIKVLTQDGVNSFEAYDSNGSLKTISVRLTKGLYNGYKFLGATEKVAKFIVADLPDFYFDSHDIPGFKPAWNYQDEGNEFSTDYGTVLVKSFKTPTGDQPIDIRHVGGNKIIIERAFTVEALLDESKMKEGYHVEYRQYIKGFMKFNGDLIKHDLYNGNPLTKDTFYEDGNKDAPPYGRRAGNVTRDVESDITKDIYKKNCEVSRYTIPQKDGQNDLASIRYQAIDLPGMPLSADETGEIDLVFQGELVVVKNGEETPVGHALMSREWRFKGKIKNKKNGNYEVLK